MSRTIPIIRLQDNLLVSIQVELSDHLVADLKEDVTGEILRTGATGLIIEVSGVDILDSYIARSIRDLAHVARLMGTRAVISGLDPSMAITLVEMGLQMTGVATALDLEGSLRLLATESSDRIQELEDIMQEEIAGETGAES